jgi:hypothetical protein
MDRSTSDDRFSLSSPTVATTWICIGFHRDRCWNPLRRFSHKDVNTGTFPGRFSLQFASLGLLALVPTIHALAEPLHAPSPLAAAFGRLVLINLFGCALYALRPLKKIGIARSWQPSLHGMYFVLTYSLVEYSKGVMQVAIPYMS